MLMATDVFLETTALIDLEFRSPALRRHVLGELPSGAASHTSRYVIFELARGFMVHLLTLHNKAVDLDRFSDFIHYVKVRGAFPGYAGQTMLGAYEDFVQHLEATGIALTEQQRLH